MPIRICAPPSLYPSGGQDKPSGQAVDSCWFCLSNAGADLSLVASVGEESYVALDKGQIAPTHVLLVPIEHYPSSVCLSEAAKGEVDRCAAGLSGCWAKQVAGKL